MKTQVKVSAILVTQSLGVEHQAMERIGGEEQEKIFLQADAYSTCEQKILVAIP
jgi:hypothetical protein